MQVKRTHKRVPTVFRGYFSKRYINELVKKLYVVMPHISVLMQRLRPKLNGLSHMLVKLLVSKNGTIAKRLGVIDLTQMKNTLAIELEKKPGRKINITNNPHVRYDKLDMTVLLRQQTELLRTLLAEQQQQMKAEAQEFMKQERQRIRETINSKYRN